MPAAHAPYSARVAVALVPPARVPVPAALLSAQLTARVRRRECLLALAAPGVEPWSRSARACAEGPTARTLPGVRALSVSRPEHLEQL